MPDADPTHPLEALSPEEKAELAGSFGGVASEYERYRPGPPVAAVEWMLPASCGRVVDLGAGTGALTRLLVGRADEVVAVEPDDQMRAVLTDEVPGARAVTGRGEAIPVPDRSADAVLASSSWHWMDPAQTLGEVARVLLPGGTLGAVWSGPDRDGEFLRAAMTLLAERSGDRDGSGVPAGRLAGLVGEDGVRPNFALEISDGAPFTPPEHEVFTWDLALDADDLIGLLGTFSWIITMDDKSRDRLFAESRRLLREHLGVEGDVTVDVAFRADAYRSVRA